LLMGTFLIVAIFLFPNFLRYGIVWQICLSIITPLLAVTVQGKYGWVIAILGTIIGGIIGFAIGYTFGPFFSDIIYGSIPLDIDERFDLVLWRALSLGFFASIGALLGGFYGRNRSNDISSIHK
ncbi:MAG: hypothetical protein JRE61_14805, partial [Deltaproteobacteria bacterium]|nr:hypothetical protein [Deltaproteobacteria bacterium]